MLHDSSAEGHAAGTAAIPTSSREAHTAADSLGRCMAVMTCTRVKSDLTLYIKDRYAR